MAKVPGLSPMTRRELRERERAVARTSDVVYLTPQARRAKPFKRRMLAMFLSAGAMTGAALMMVSTSVPANAFLTKETPLLPVASTPETLEVQVAEWAPQGVEATQIVRENYTATSMREQLSRLSASQNFMYYPNPAGTIRWPFPYVVPISSGYGPRPAPCAECSTFHRGVDFLPGYGVPIGVIADGVVVSVNAIHWSFGQHVLVEHVINGETIQSLYAHMAVDTIRVSVGQALEVGDVVGLVGSTGQSVGPHLHFEVRIGGEPIDAFAWLQQNAN